eukprot:10773308-Alexandrium_andersonii.AAC.1
MSASLVGSEMCIRDRSMSRAKAACPGVRAATASRSAALARRVPNMLGSCLLYTSDAADDM